MLAPLSIPPLARYFKDLGIGNGWEMAFLVIGALGFLWMGLWMFYYRKPAIIPVSTRRSLHTLSRTTILLMSRPGKKAQVEDSDTAVIPFFKCFRYPQTWAVIFGKFMTDGVWWFFLFWIPAYISDVYGFASDSGTAQLLIFVLYALTMLSIYGGKLPTVIMNRTGLNPYSARMRAMFIFALFPLLALLAQPLGAYSYWWPIIIIGIAGAGASVVVGTIYIR